MHGNIARDEVAGKSLLGCLRLYVDAVAHGPTEHGDDGVESVGAFGCCAQPIYPLRPHSFEHAFKLWGCRMMAFVADYEAIVLDEVFYSAFSGNV